MTIQDITRLIVLLTFTEYDCRLEHEEKVFRTAVFLTHPLLYIENMI